MTIAAWRYAAARNLVLRRQMMSLSSSHTLYTGASVQEALIQVSHLEKRDPDPLPNHVLKTLRRPAPFLFLGSPFFSSFFSNFVFLLPAPLTRLQIGRCPRPGYLRANCGLALAPGFGIWPPICCWFDLNSDVARTPRRVCYCVVWVWLGRRPRPPPSRAGQGNKPQTGERENKRLFVSHPQ